LVCAKQIWLVYAPGRRSGLSYLGTTHDEAAVRALAICDDEAALAREFGHLVDTPRA
jgi:hypothetical protein